MKKETVLTIAVVLLLLLNLALLGYLLVGKGHHPPHSRPDKLIVKTLGLDEDQQEKFEELKHWHRSQIVNLDLEFAKNLEAYFLQVMQAQPDTVMSDSLLTVMAGIEKEKVRVTYVHFKDIQSLCTPEQRERFDAIMPRLVKILLSHGK